MCPHKCVHSNLVLFLSALFLGEGVLPWVRRSCKCSPDIEMVQRVLTFYGGATAPFRDGSSDRTNVRQTPVSGSRMLSDSMAKSAPGKSGFNNRGWIIGLQNTVTDGYFKSKEKQRGWEGALPLQTVRAQYLPNSSEELPREQGKKKKKPAA